MMPPPPAERDRAGRDREHNGADSYPRLPKHTFYYHHRNGWAALARALHRIASMQPTTRAIALTVALSGIVACENPFANGPLPHPPGVPVSGLTYSCPRDDCGAWSADSKTLYIAARVGTSSVTSLVAVDPVTLTVRTVGRIDHVFGLVSSADGAAVYFVATDTAASYQLAIKKMSSSDGSTTILAHTYNIDFVVSPDGTALAYHALGSNFGADTIVLLDQSSGTRRATMIENSSRLAAFSEDGTRLAMIPGGGGPEGGSAAVNIWHVTTGVREVIPFATNHAVVLGAAWSHGDFRVLFGGGDFTAFTDTSLGGGAALTYRDGRRRFLSRWLPDRSAIWTLANDTVICGPDDCHRERYDYAFTTATQTTTLASAISQGLILFAASPDGKWLAHAEGASPLYLTHGVTP